MAWRILSIRKGCPRATSQQPAKPRVGVPPQFATVSRQRPKIIQTLPWHRRNRMISSRNPHHIVIAHRKRLVEPLVVVETHQPEARLRLHFEKIHVLQPLLASRHAIVLMWRKTRPVPWLIKRLAPQQTFGGKRLIDQVINRAPEALFAAFFRTRSAHNPHRPRLLCRAFDDHQFASLLT